MASSQAPPSSTLGGRSVQGAPEASTDGEEDAGEAFVFEDSEEEESPRLVMSKARTELGTREALQDPPPRRRSSISDDLEPLDEWEAEEALLEGQALVTQAGSSTSLDFLGSQPQTEFVVSNGDVVGSSHGRSHSFSWKRKSFRRGHQFNPPAPEEEVIYDDVPSENMDLDQCGMAPPQMFP